MIGILVVVVVSWLLLWFVSKEHLTALGIVPSRIRFSDFSLGFLLTFIVCGINLLWQAHFKEISYTLNPSYGILDALNGVFWTAKGVLFEELIFRGVVLYWLVKKLGPVKASLMDALVFGIYHWFSYGMFGAGIVPMVYVLLVTGAGGWMFAYAFAKTKSLYAPIGLHLGWNLVSIVVLSDGPIGSQLLVPSGEGTELGFWSTLLFFLWQLLVAPAIVTWYLSKKYRLSS